MVFFACTLAAPTIAAQDLPPGKFADLTLKILTYDRHLKDRVAGRINIGVVSSSANSEAASTLLSSFAERQGRKVLGTDFEARLIDLDAEGELQASFSDGALTCLVVFGDVDADLEELAKLTRQHGVLSVASRKEQLAQLSLGLVIEGNKVKIYRSDEALAGEGILLEASFLNVTRPL